MPEMSPPSSILIVGSGAFGLSTALALTSRPAYASTKITLLDRSAFPSPDSSSIDTSRIIRPDYASPAYAALASEAQTLWRGEWGAGGRYNESGLVLTAEVGQQEYVRASLDNVRQLASDIGDKDGVKELRSGREIDEVVATGGGSGMWGYINRRSGWADAHAAMRYCRQKVEDTGRVDFVTGEAIRLLLRGSTVEGVQLKGGDHIMANLVVLAAGAWTGKLVDLRGRAQATGQVLAYMDITAEEQDALGKMPVLLNLGTGMFVMPPKDRLLKVARHGYGYSNPTEIQHPEKDGERIEVSLPRTQVDEPGQWIPMEGEKACRQAVRKMIPRLGDRPFRFTRICWYTDTPEGDFLITYHPNYTGLFIATGGSGHGFKFLPVIGEKIIDTMNGNLPQGFEEKWKWPEEACHIVNTEDGSRGGSRGMTLDTEMKRRSML
ncbi:MAG: hypothetical protein M1827_002772 [Pycnora praestabilis]|nr:MAG: hypothetical protein M1827_002772 [Pycnora praestabilis]